MTIREDLRDFEITRYDDKPEVGKEYAIAERKNILSGSVSYVFRLIRGDGTDGFGGNLDHNVKRFHGWRGTTNDVSKTALGVFRILSIVEQKNGLSRIKLSEDLHPDWD